MTVYLEIDGEPVNRDELIWVERASCGCYSGVASAGHFNATSPEQAAAEVFSDTAAQRKRKAQDGFTIEIARHASFDYSQFTDCPHDPRWGYKVKIPDGYHWAAPVGERARTMHLVRDDSGRALCGRRESRWDGRFLDGLVTCRRCEANTKVLGDTPVEREIERREASNG